MKHFLLILFFILSVSAKAQFTWQLLQSSPSNGQKQDDVFFLDRNLGWSVNGSGRIFKTTNGGQTWTRQLDQPGTYFRCIGFLDSLRGFAGNIGPNYFPNVSDANPLYQTNDGGRTWQTVNTISGPMPTGLCAIQIIDSLNIVAAGRVGSPVHLIKSTDGGLTWSSQSMSAHCAMILDLHFFSPDTGLVFCGTSANVQLSNAKVIRTTDGGATFQTVYQSTRPFEICWKASFPSRDIGYFTVLSYAPNTTERFVAKTTDGGQTWSERPLISNGSKAFGIGFLNDSTGWIGTDMGGLQTTNGGQTWTNRSIGQFVNKIRILNDGTGYAIGLRIFKMNPAVTATPEAPVTIPNRFVAYPNPSNGTLNLQANFQNAGPLKIDLVDQKGKVINQLFKGMGKVGKQTITLRPDSNYRQVLMLRISSSDGVSTLLVNFLP